MFIYTHYLGTGLELSVLRENSSLGNNCFDETQIVERNLNYDFNFQQFVYLPRGSVYNACKYINNK